MTQKQTRKEYMRPATAEEKKIISQAWAFGYDDGKTAAIKQVLEIYEKLYRENDEVPPEMLKQKLGELK